MKSFKTYSDDVHNTTDIYRSLPFYDTEVFVRSNVYDSCNEALQKPKIFSAHLSTGIVDDITLNYIQNDCVIFTTSLQRPVCMCDGGANRSVTNDKSALHGIKPIPLHYIGGIGSGIQCVSKGWYDITATDHTTLSVPMFYAPDATETVISPTDIVNTYPDKFDSVLQNFDVGADRGQLIFYKKADYSNDIHSITNKMQFKIKEGFPCTAISLVKHNNLYYVADPVLNAIYSTTLKESSSDDSTLNTTSVALYDLWHYRLGHPGHHTMKILHKHADGVPILKVKNPFFKCKNCYQNLTKNLKGYSLHKNEAVSPFQRIQMDFGFVSYKSKDGKGTLLRSRQGFGSYLLIIDEYTRYIWVFPTKTKEPPIEVVDQFLMTYKLKEGMRRVRTDLGKELARSREFRALITKHGYVLETTAANSSFQNSKAERPHRTLANMMRSMLKCAGLDKSFWADALMHAVYLRNRLPHATLNMSPYEKMTDRKPNLSHLRVFGSRVIVKEKDERNGKLSDNCVIGIFLRYTGTDRNIYFYDTKTHQTREARHVEYDETYFHEASAPPYAQRLKNMVQTELANAEINKLLPKHLPNNHNDSSPTKETTEQHTTQPAYVSDDESNTNESKHEIDQIQHLQCEHFSSKYSDAQLPVKANKEAAGYDLFAHKSKTIAARGRATIGTGITFQCPAGYFGHILSRSGLAVKNGLQVGAGVIDRDYEGEIKVVLFNLSDTDYNVKKGDRIAQLVIQKILDFSISDYLMNSSRGENGFGSTDAITAVHNSSTDIPVHQSQKESITKNDDAQPTNLDLDDYKNMDLHDTPYNESIQIKIRNRGSHPTRGLLLKDCEGRLLLKSCQPSTPAARIPQWRSLLRDAIVDSIDGVHVDTVKDIECLIQVNKNKSIKIGLIPQMKLPSHPSENFPIIHFDQFRTIAYQHMAAKHDSEPWMDSLHAPDIDKDFISALKQNNSKLTRNKLQQQDDWNLWKIAEYQQLNQYKSQNMFGDPIERPKDANVLPLIWIYVYKSNGVRKARCVCNGSPRMKGTVTLDHTYAAALEQTGARIFWALSAIYNYVVSGGDASNAFAEASAPKAKLFVTIDAVFREWYTEIEKKPLIPQNYVLPVNHALQGHPESPRLWSNKIHSIMTKLGYKNTTHESCLYVKYIEDKPIFFLRQVDDFLISSKHEQIANRQYDLIQKSLKEPMKRFGIVTAFNGTDVSQTKNFIKVSCKTYISKILKGHGWENLQHSATTTTPMRSDSKYILELETSRGPTEVQDQKTLATEMKFSYRQAIGELLFAAITCRPDVMYPVIKLSQYSNAPAKIHFVAVKNVFRYLRATIDEGLHYWRDGQRDDLPFVASPDLLPDNYSINHPNTSPRHPDAFVDSDWGGNIANRKSISGSTIFMAGAPILYKTKMQPTVALSSTEAEFVAASETGKMVLYVRSILDDLGIYVEDATPMYIDNSGARQMANARKPTRRTRHLDIRYFALTEWTERDLIILKPISTSDNNSDALTKALGRQLFTRHKSTLLGHRRPTYM